MPGSDTSSARSLSQTERRSLGDWTEFSHDSINGKLLLWSCDYIVLLPSLRPALPVHLPDLLYISDCAHGLFISTTYLVCQRLISSWKSDLNVSLAALEVLSALARIHIKETDALEPKRAVKWLCDYIVIQCSRPPPAHSKDLHSTIVAAFSCLSVWLVAHPTLLDDKECLATVLDVVELGISGSISQVSRVDYILKAQFCSIIFITKTFWSLTWCQH